MVLRVLNIVQRKEIKPSVLYRHKTPIDVQGALTFNIRKLEIFRLRNPPNVFMNMNNGELFYTRDGKDYPIRTKQSNGKVFADHNGYTLDVLKIVLEALGTILDGTERITYNVTHAGYISPPSLKVVRAPEGDNGMFVWRCDLKAAGCNARFKDKLSKEAIYQVLEISKFMCVYCRRPLDPKKWHLDHYLPRAKGGKNTIDNICPSCSDCNMMKGALLPNTFVKNCYIICMNNGVTSPKFQSRYQTFLRAEGEEMIDAKESFSNSLYSFDWPPKQLTQNV